MGLVDRLAGSKKDRVKALRLRGVVSQGICYPAKPEWVEGQDVAEELGIFKWIPPIPVCMAGEVNSGGLTLNFDIENIKRYPDMFVDGEEVFVTEKLHGSCTILALVPSTQREPDMFYGKYQLISKGLAAKGLYFKDNEKNAGNLYVRVLRELAIFDKFEKACDAILEKFKDAVASYGENAVVNIVDEPIWLLGETFGNGVQDLKYGHSKPTYRAFAMRVGRHWLYYDVFLELCERMDIPTVPVIYRGEYKKELVHEWSNGKTVEGNGCHMREGVVIAATKYRECPVGRPILKSISDEYLLRKGEVTEFE
jgi:RNA ligase (TIGR02306 family)